MNRDNWEENSQPNFSDEFPGLPSSRYTQYINTERDRIYDQVRQLPYEIAHNELETINLLTKILQPLSFTVLAAFESGEEYIGLYFDYARTLFPWFASITDLLLVLENISNSTQSEGALTETQEEELETEKECFPITPEQAEVIEWKQRKAAKSNYNEVQRSGIMAFLHQEMWVRSKEYLDDLPNLLPQKEDEITRRYDEAYLLVLSVFDDYLEDDLTQT